jgi:glycosyltransferase involved in cell wall biosynthesis
MRLLFLTETIPFPLDSGGRIKTFNVLQILGREHEVHCHAMVRDDKLLRFEQELARSVAALTLHYVPRSLIGEATALISSLAARTPFLVRRHFHRHVMDRLAAVCRQRQFDAVYCDHLSMLEYGRRLALPIVLDAHNIEYEIIRRHAATMGWSPLRAMAELEWRRLEQYERRWYPRCRLIFVVSRVDERVIRELAGSHPEISVVPIAVDARSATVVGDAAAAGPEILFVGGLHWPPNADAVIYFIQEIFPRVRAAVPGVRFTVVGRSGDQVQRRTGAPAGVQFPGHVESVEPYFQRSRVMVVPIRSGSGMRVKILDGLARGMPTVTTTVGCEGIDVQPETHALVADGAADFAESVIRVLKDDALARRLSAQGRRLAVETYDTSAIADRVLRSMQIVAATSG